jgi:hypothetical protein
MRRVTITLAAALMVLAVIPASAIARSHRRHHSRTHHARVHHVRIRHFGSDPTTGTSSNSSDTAGTVHSFDSNTGVLTITLNDGSMVSGVVNNNTELECTAPEDTQTVHMDGDGGSGDQSGSDDQSGSGDDNQTSGTDDQSATEDQGDAAEQNENQAEDQNENEAAEENEDAAENNCSTANLTPGTMVREAELKISSAGSVWDKVELES